MRGRDSASGVEGVADNQLESMKTSKLEMWMAQNRDLAVDNLHSVEDTPAEDNYLFVAAVCIDYAADLAQVKHSNSQSNNAKEYYDIVRLAKEAEAVISDPDSSFCILFPCQSDFSIHRLRVHCQLEFFVLVIVSAGLNNPDIESDWRVQLLSRSRIAAVEARSRR